MVRGARVEWVVVWVGVRRAVEAAAVALVEGETEAAGKGESAAAEQTVESMAEAGKVAEGTAVA